MRYGGSELEWQKVKGIGYVDVDGESYKADVHWYQEDNLKIDVKHTVKGELE